MNVRTLYIRFMFISTSCRLYCAVNYLNSVESEQVLKQKFPGNKTHNLCPKTFSVSPNFFYIIQQIRAKAEESKRKLQIY